MKLIKVRLMRSRVLILVFLGLVFLSPLFVAGGSDPYGDDTWYSFPPGVDYDEHIKLQWKDEGDLIYWYIEVTGKIKFIFMNSSNFEAERWDKVIFSTMIETGKEHEYNITLPYDGTFYFVMVNQAGGYSDINGWYAKDETEPDGNIWGLNTNFANEVLLGSTRDISCMFNDRFDIVNLVFYENDVMMRTFGEYTDPMVEWTISDYEFTTLGMIEISFKAEDRGRNVGVVSKTVEVVNKLSSLPTHSEPEYFDWVGVFEDYWFVMIPVGTLLGIGIILGLEKAGKLH